VLTKAVSSQSFNLCLNKLGICDIDAPTWGEVLKIQDIQAYYILYIYFFITVVLSLLEW
jgi:hypothetical protein